MKPIFYTIGQVSEMMELPQSVLRYWESVFDSLNPHKSSGGSRQYSENDIEVIKVIKVLLYDQGFTIKGAINRLKNSKSGNIQQQIDGLPNVNNSTTKEIVAELKEIINILES